jgi:hypothetical protein
MISFSKSIKFFFYFDYLALALMETWKNYKVPTAPELFWMIPHDEDLPQEFLPLPDGISIDPSEDYLSNDDGQRVNFFFRICTYM